jgi:hypothetical protein
MTQPLEKGNSYTIDVAVVKGSGNFVKANRIDVSGVKVMIPPAPSESLPILWKVPSKNSNFTGRSELLKKIEHHFSQNNDPAILTACHGLGGIGKTQVALEFVWQHYKN